MIQQEEIARNSQDDLEKRAAEMSEILELPIDFNTCFQFRTVNFAAWKTVFYKKAKKDGKKFTIKTQKDGSKKIWRIK